MAPNANDMSANPGIKLAPVDPLDEDFGFQPEDVVVSGFSGRFPECDSIDELRENLYAGVDMVNDKENRWPYGKRAD